MQENRSPFHCFEGGSQVWRDENIYDKEDYSESGMAERGRRTRLHVRKWRRNAVICRVSTLPRLTAMNRSLSELETPREKDCMGLNLFFF